VHSGGNLLAGALPTSAAANLRGALTSRRTWPLQRRLLRAFRRRLSLKGIRGGLDQQPLALQACGVSLLMLDEPLNGHTQILNEHGQMLREILSRLA
jgi:hypothetical protein